MNKYLDKIDKLDAIKDIIVYLSVDDITIENIDTIVKILEIEMED